MDRGREDQQLPTMRCGWAPAWGRAVLMFAVAWGLAGCGEQASVETTPAGRTLCQSDFNLCVNPVFNQPLRRADNAVVTCASGGCHEVGVGFGGAFKIYPNATTQQELLANLIVAKAFSNLDIPQDSKLLLEPLAGTSSITGSHTGGDIFPSAADACYVSIRNWIANPVSDDTSPQCGVCTVPNFAQCGYP